MTEYHPRLPELLSRAGLSGQFEVQPLTGGRNNRIFRVDINGRSALLKAYFCHPADQRDRLATEFAFSTFVWQQGIRSLPRPLAQLPEAGLGLYEYIEGRRLTLDEITPEFVQQALDFYLALNQARQTTAAQQLPLASEARFSIADHLQTVAGRVGRLQNISAGTDIDGQARVFVNTELADAWQMVQQSAHRQAAELGLAPEQPLSAESRRLSPSDFGFHNALWLESDRLKFIDFEYAGWDDPAKMVCDFFCQPAVPVPRSYFEPVVEAVTVNLPDVRLHRQRITLLMPVYRLKWACMLLNEFLPVAGRRRQFAGSNLDFEQRKATQLSKAQAMLRSVTLKIPIEVV